MKGVKKMRTYVVDYDLENTNEYLNEIIDFKQGDNNQQIKINILYKGVSAELPGYSAVCSIKQPDGINFTKAANITGNTVIISLDSPELSKTGYCTIEISLINGTTTTTTFGVKYRVIGSIMFDSLIQPDTKKYAILLVAGQSNAVGYDESAVDPIFDTPDKRIKQLGFKGENNLKIVPLTHCAENYQDMSKSGIDNQGTKGIHLPLAKRILKHIPEDYELLVIPAAYGGSAFTRGTEGTYNMDTKKPVDSTKWGISAPLYLATKDRLEYALSLNEKNYYIGTVWCQGEFDTNATTQKTAFEEMTQDFFTYFNGKYKNRVKGGVWSKDQWFIYETVPYWTKQGGSAANGQYATHSVINEIWQGYRQWSQNTYVTIDIGTGASADKYTNLFNGKTPINGQNGSTSSYGASHYGNGAFEKVVAPAVYKKMLENNLFGY